MTERMPSLFVSHGSPMTALMDTPAHRWFKSYAAQLPKPRAILIATAHFEEDVPVFTHDAKPEMIYDFGGFPRPLYEMVYSAPGDPDLAMKAAHMVNDAGFRTGVVQNRGYDHGTWVPLKLMYPDADIPVVQVSVQHAEGSAHHIKVGKALAPLRGEGVLIMGSGSLTHNLWELSRRRGEVDAKALDWVVDFTEWVAEKVGEGDAQAIGDYRAQAPHAKENHPRDEHFLPLPFAMGAGVDAEGHFVKGKRVHASYDYGLLAMDAFQFN